MLSLEKEAEEILAKSERFLQKHPLSNPKVTRLLVALKERNFKLTAPRLTILEEICNFEGDFALNNLLKRLENKPEKVGQASVFRTVKLLNELGLLIKKPSADGSHLYTLEIDHHHQVVCRGCGKQVEFGGCELTDLSQAIEAATGFALQGHWLEFFGYCGDCQPHQTSIKNPEPNYSSQLWIKTPS